MITTFLETQVKGEKKSKNPNPLALAAKAGHRGCVAALMRLNDAQKYVKITDDTGRTALHYACLEGQAGVVEEFLIGLSKQAVNATDKEGMTPLMAACFTQRTEIASLLLGHPDINKDVNDSTGATALHWACSNGDVETCKALIGAGAKLVGTSEGRTPLHAAAWAGHSACIEAILKNDAKKELTCDTTGANPLHFACFAGNADCVRTLLNGPCPVTLTVRLVLY